MKKIAVACLLATLLLTPTLVASAHDQLKVGRNDGPYSTPYNTPLGRSACTASSRHWVQELGKSGVTRLRSQWVLRSPNDTGILPTYGRTNWAYSPSFQNDAMSRYAYFRLPAYTLNFSAGSEYALWTKNVGERPSWWQRDLVVKTNLGALGCEQLQVQPPSPPPTLAPGFTPPALRRGGVT